MKTPFRIRRARAGAAQSALAGLLTGLALASSAWAQYDIPRLQPGYPNPYCPTVSNLWNRPVAYTPGGGVVTITNQMAIGSGVFKIRVTSGYTRQNQIGVPIVGLTSQYGIGDILPRPEGVPDDWIPLIGTNGNPDCVQWATFSNTNLLLAVDEGVAFILWATNASSTTGVSVAYAVGPNLMRRPVRLFWTEGQYAGPRVQFGNNYEVKIWYNSQIRDPFDPATPDVNPSNATLIANEQLDQVSPPTIFIKNSALRAMADTRGRVLLTYSRRPEGVATNVRELLAYEVVDVLEPMSSTIEANVGGRLLPKRRDYNTDALFCDITRGGMDASGQQPDQVFTYRHMAGKRNGWVWAIRPTDAPWQIEIFWKAKEKLDVIWPFEVDIYDVTWNPDSQLCALVAGARSGNDNGVFFPSEVRPEIQPYQASQDASASGPVFVRATTPIARIASDVFRGNTPGICTLKYTAGDDVWFETIRLVWETDPLVHQGVKTWSIGDEIRPFLTAGIAGADYDTWPGLIRVPASAPTGAGITNFPGDRWDRYHAGLYKYPAGYPASDADLQSQIFAVNRGHLGVWWWNPSAVSVNEEMPATVFWPSLVCDYRDTWPKSPRQIVIASFAGSVTDTWIPDTTGSLHLPGSVAGEATLLPRPAMTSAWESVTYPNAFVFETRVKSDSLTGWRGLMSMHADSSNNLCFFLQDGVPGVALITRTDLPPAGDLLRWTTSTQTWFATDVVWPGDWTHVGLSYAAGTLRFFIEGMPAGAYDDAPAGLNVPLLEPVPLGMSETWTSPVARGGFGYFNGWMDEIRLWYGDRTDTQIAAYYGAPLETPDGLICRFNFDPATPIDATLPTGSRRDLVGNLYVFPTSGAALDPDESAPLTLSGKAYVGMNPRIYVQNDSAAAGYNPNEEHALIVDSIAYALRCDLNIPAESSQPYTLVQYSPDPETWRQSLDVYQVIPSNLIHRFVQNIEAGKMIQPPRPLRSILPDNCFNTHCDPGDVPLIFRDRRQYFWAKQAHDNGIDMLEIGMRFFYPLQLGFWIPQLTAGKQPKPLTEMPWLSALGGDQSEDTILNGEPVKVAFDIYWPATVPTLSIGDTLSIEKNNLPAVRGQKSVRVVYQQSLKQGKGDSGLLIDPTRARKTLLGKVPPNMRAMRDPKTGNTFFSDLDPDLRQRLFYVPTAVTNERLWLKGIFVKYTTYHYLRLNLLTPDLVEMATDPNRMTGMDDTWKDAILSLPTNRWETPDESVPFDSQALVTPGLGAGYLTLVFNNSTNIDMVDPGDPISMEVIRIDTNLFRGQIDIIQSSNPLDKYMTLRHIGDFAAIPQRWAFEWMYAWPDSYGMAPTTNSADWKPLINAEPGRYTTIFGSSGEFGLADTYVRARYRAQDPGIISVVGTNWSGWTEPAFCEGWIKRVLKAINPFDQRIRDFMNYALNTQLSMIQQAGSPYVGNMPMNMEALNSYGLIPIYETVLDQSRDLSIDSTLDTSATPNIVCLALMLAAGRLNDMYMTLANEAYADAMNPTLALGNADPALAGEASSIFAFQGIVPTLLAEELALLRGRDCSAPVNPSYDTFPIYNRLPWNFTYDVTHGQVAYVLNYGISDLKANQDGSVDADDAAAMYPQGHGDAWGQYLSAVKAYYALFRHRNFTWFPQLEGIRVGQMNTTMSALHEKKFAAAAAAKARAGVAITDRTYRSLYEEGMEEPWRVQRDARTNPAWGERHWGVGEWGARAAMGAYCDWIMANALLPHEVPPDDVVTAGGNTNYINPLAVIDRTTVPELTELVVAAADLQRLVDLADRGLNPLGLGRDAVPFDISPAEIDQGHTHFEQAYDKAFQALKVAKAVFDRVQTCTAAIRDQNEARDFDTTVLQQEQSYDRQLVGIYGFPYQEDMGPGKAYPEGYVGPDLTHYSYINRYDYFGRIPLTGSTIDTTVVVPTIVGTGIRPYDPGEIVPAPTFTDPALTLEAILQFVSPEYAAKYEEIKGKYEKVRNTVGMTKEKVDALGIPELSQFYGEVLGAYNTVEQAIFGAVEDVVGWFDGVISAPVDEIDNFISQWVGPGVELAPLKVQGPNITYSTNRLSFFVGPDGLPTKPASYQSSRRAEGEVQIALSQYVLALREVTKAIGDSDRLYKQVLAADRSFRSTLGAQMNAYYARVDALDNMNSLQQIIEIANKAIALVDKVYKDAMEVYESVQTAIPDTAGMSFDIGAIVRGPVRAGTAVVNLCSTIQRIANFENVTATEEDLRRKKEILDLNAEAQKMWNESAVSAREVVNAALTYLGSLDTLDVALQKAETFRMQYQRAIADGDMIQVEREQSRRIWASDLTGQRYRNMAYQIFRNDDLARYDQAYNMAAKYVYLAAKAYDYETGLLRADGSVGAPGREFLSQIVRARALGRFTADGTPLPGGSTGDPGLADIVARLSANWSVLKGRLNFNNPQTETGMFSLRKELFRIPAGAAFDDVWRRKLKESLVPDVKDLADFRVYCLPFTPSDGAEPALVIPFSTTIDFKKNFFGLPLAAGDNAYDSTHFATKVRGVGVWFTNYRNTMLANQPRVYLVPVGEDQMRVPDGVGETTRAWSILDQALPIPYQLSNESWMKSDWHVSTDVLGGEFFLRRRYASLRAYHDSGFAVSEMTPNARLIGRSVWNSRWLLIIPGGTLLADADKGLLQFVNGRELAPDSGAYDGEGVKDIKLFFQTYSYSGN